MLEQDDELMPIPQPKLFTWLGKARMKSKTSTQGKKGRIIGVYTQKPFCTKL